MDFRRIDLQDWVPNGGGGTATSYYHKTDPELMLKLFTQGITGDDYALTEFDLSHKVEALGLRTPKAIELVKAGDCAGVIYRRVADKVSVSRLCADDPHKIEQYAESFAAECRSLHEKECNTADFPSRKLQILEIVRDHDGYSRHTKSVISAAISRLGNQTTCLHGDMQSGNLILAGGESYWIDLGSFSWGDPMFDIAGLYFYCMHPMGRIWGSRLCHLSFSQLRRFWKAFARAYSTNPYELEKTAGENIVLFLAYTIGLRDFKGITAKMYDAYINAICMFKD